MPDTSSIVESAIRLPQDHYLHPQTGNEWWWHTGTLRSNDRVFGFEINAAEREFGGQRVLFSQIMLTDVQNQKHYQKTTPFPYGPGWAEADPRKPWRVSLGNRGGDGGVMMTANALDVGKMTIDASFNDVQTGTPIRFSLQLNQQGQPLLVWGTGVSPGTGPVDPAHRNFYYSFTRLHASGSIAIDGKPLPVTGLTWMDHEYGLFAEKTTWILQDAQLSNGWHLSCFATDAPRKDVRQASYVTLLSPNGESLFYDSFTTPRGPVWTNPQGVSYCTVFQVEIPKVGAELVFTSLMPDQEFHGEVPVYEGAAKVEGFMFQPRETVRGTGWIEQALKSP